MKKLVFWFGLLLLLVYWVSIHPPGFSRGYSEDLCTDVVRQMMADSLQKYGAPTFHSENFMAPYGASIPFMSWQIERDWLGAYFWMWNRDFPFLWVYFGASLLLSFLGIGILLKKMGLDRGWAWGVATAVVLFHVPRHFKIWHHFEHLTLHWVYLALFLDAWIWQRFWREKKWSWTLELWRGVLMLGVFGTAGYFWGPMILEWALVRGFQLVIWNSWRKRGIKLQIEGTLREAVLPFVLGVVLFVIDLRWFSALFREISGKEDVHQGFGWFAHLKMIVRPLWIYSVADLLGWKISPPDATETVVAVGWFYWVPAIIGLFLLRKKTGGPGWKTVAPFLVLLVIGILYAMGGKPYLTVKLTHALVPFMKYFRVGSRWGLFFPLILTVMIVLSWRELSAWVRARAKKKTFVAAVVAFAALSILEFKWMLVPVNALPPMPEALTRMLEGIRQSPGTTVLDLPFCVAGGNGVCSSQQCPNYPYSTVGMCLREWHEKKVYTLYQARMLFSHCETYNRQPYLSWFDAWQKQRCFTPAEWGDFCQYLAAHPENSAILLYPDIWAAAARPECMKEFVDHLGEPLDVVSYFSSPTRGGKGAAMTRVMRFAPQCRTVLAPEND